MAAMEYTGMMGVLIPAGVVRIYWDCEAYYMCSNEGCMADSRTEYYMCGNEGCMADSRTEYYMCGNEGWAAQGPEMNYGHYNQGSGYRRGNTYYSRDLAGGKWPKIEATEVQAASSLTALLGELWTHRAQINDEALRKQISKKVRDLVNLTLYSCWKEQVDECVFDNNGRWRSWRWRQQLKRLLHESWGTELRKHVASQLNGSTKKALVDLAKSRSAPCNLIEDLLNELQVLPKAWSLENYVKDYQNMMEAALRMKGHALKEYRGRKNCRESRALCDWAARGFLALRTKEALTGDYSGRFLWRMVPAQEYAKIMNHIRALIRAAVHSFQEVEEQGRQKTRQADCEETPTNSSAESGAEEEELTSSGSEEVSEMPKKQMWADMFDTDDEEY